MSRVTPSPTATPSPTPKPELKRIKCANCDKRVWPNRIDQRFCSTNCRREFHRYGSSYGKLKDHLHKLIRSLIAAELAPLIAEEQTPRGKTRRIEVVNLVRGLVDRAKHEDAQRAELRKFRADSAAARRIIRDRRRATVAGIAKELRQLIEASAIPEHPNERRDRIERSQLRLLDLEREASSLF